MPDDLEHTLRDSLDRHARATGQPTGELGDVFTRVDRRRTRRRSVAIIGSFAVVAAGVLGIAAISRSGGSAELGAADDDGSPTTTVVGAWACTGGLGGDQSWTYFADCHQVAWDQATSALCDAEVAPTTAVPMTVPVTTVPVVTTRPPCPYPVDPAAESCAQVVPTTVPPMTVAITTAPVTVAVEAATATTYVVVDCPSPSTEVTDTTSVGTAPSTSAPQPPNSTYAPNELERSYPVEAGDSIYAIAARFGLDPEVVVAYNDWTDGIQHLIVVGDIVKIPPNLSDG